MKVSICILTYNRPEGLKRLLASLKHIVFIKCERPELEVVVIDNYIRGNARDICATLQQELALPLIFEVEHHRGISFARNRAIESSSTDSNLIAFLDDDETPEPNWLDELLHAHNLYCADIVNGAVLPVFTCPVPKWILKGAFFNRQRFITGHTLSEARTGNVLIRKSLLRDLGGFDPRFALTGGEDVYFSLLALNTGSRAIWSDEAIVYEWIPQSRMSALWLLRRGFRTGNSAGRGAKYMCPSLSIKSLWIARGLSRIAKGLLRAPSGIIVGKHLLIKHLQLISNGAGIISGVLGFSYNEYSNTHGN